MIRAEGRAVIQANTGETFEVQPGDLDWQQVGGDERGMGPETLWEAEVEFTDRNDDLVTATWQVSEYPVGAINNSTCEVDGGKLTKDFSLSWKHERE